MSPHDPNERYFTDEGRAAAIGVFEQEGREQWQMMPEIMAALALRPGMIVADVGAGTGYFTRELAVRVAPDGRVLAADIIPEFLAELETRAAAAGLDNLDTILGEAEDPRLPPDGVDLIFMGDAYHHISSPGPVLRGFHAALRPGGRVAIVDWERAPNPRFEEAGLDWREHLRASSPEVVAEITANGFRLVEQPDFLQWQYFLIFARAD
ncbi:MAG: class I SAM-dependent methyltransferase [Acidobacteriota bacterium]|jgi:ubiquinone/menaquinone biosynthesis C-methylase UbiE